MFWIILTLVGFAGYALSVSKDDSKSTGEKTGKIVQGLLLWVIGFAMAFTAVILFSSGS